MGTDVLTPVPSMKAGKISSWTFVPHSEQTKSHNATKSVFCQVTQAHAETNLKPEAVILNTLAKTNLLIQNHHGTDGTLLKTDTQITRLVKDLAQNL